MTEMTLLDLFQTYSPTFKYKSLRDREIGLQSVSTGSQSLSTELTVQALWEIIKPKALGSEDQCKKTLREIISKTPIQASKWTLNIRRELCGCCFYVSKVDSNGCISDPYWDLWEETLGLKVNDELLQTFSTENVIVLMFEQLTKNGYKEKTVKKRVEYNRSLTPEQIYAIQLQVFEELTQGEIFEPARVD